MDRAADLLLEQILLNIVLQKYRSRIGRYRFTIINSKYMYFERMCYLQGGLTNSKSIVTYVFLISQYIVIQNSGFNIFVLSCPLYNQDGLVS